jgi:hypothetical protein
MKCRKVFALIELLLAPLALPLCAQNANRPAFRLPDACSRCDVRFCLYGSVLDWWNPKCSGGTTSQGLRLS